MGVIQSRVLPGGYTPCCSSCGVLTSWDISAKEYHELEEFWDGWECESCNPEVKGSRKRHNTEKRELRGYQDYGLNELRQAVKDGFRRILLVLPTGGGKSVIFSNLIASANKKHNPVLFLVHKRELVYQASDHMDKEGVQHGIIMAGEPMNRMKSVQLASTLTLWTRAKKNERIDMPPAKVVVVDECFTPDVEILTEAGFVRFDELSKGIKVAQINQETLHLSYVVPDEYIENEYSGNMVNIKSDKLVDLTMTPNHELLVLQSGSVKKTGVSDTALHDKKRMFVAAEHESGQDELTPHEKMMIALQADGSIHREKKHGGASLLFSFTKKRKIDDFIALVNDTGYHWNEVKSVAKKGNTNKKRRFIVDCLIRPSKNLWEHFSLPDISASKAGNIIEYMAKWDGSILNEGMLYFSSTDESATDFYQSVAIMAGYKTNKTVQVDGRKASYKDVYRLFIDKKTNKIGTQQIEKSVSHYSGKVYCVRVPEGNIIVRRGGKPLVIGNCHRTGSKTYNQILDDYDDAIIIGVTATPVRKNGRGLGKQFEKMIVVSSISELQELGFLCRTEYMVPNIPDLSEVDINDGEFVEEQLEKVMDKANLVGNIVDHYIRYAKGRQAVLFAAGVRHSMHLRDAFRMKGVNAEHIDANTPTNERMEIHDRFERGDVQVICNYAIYTEGVDMPELSCIINARPSRSLVFHLQSIGRGLRPKADGGNCLIIDHAGNVLRMGPVEMDHHWSLDEFEVIYERDAEQEERKEKEQKITEFICGHCGTLFESAPRCPTCGEPVEKVGKDVKVAKGELTLYKPKRKKKDTEPTMDEKQHWYSMFLYYARQKGYQDGWVSHKYKDKFGVWPKGMTDDPIPPSLEFNNYMKHLRIKYIKQQEKKREQPRSGS